nr:hypothetical protein [uncultured Halomonas sp.]
MDGFRGRALYAVKANPSPDLIGILWDNGITHYDVASIAEVRLVRGLLPDAELCFMHPVKPRSAIAEAYHQQYLDKNPGGYCGLKGTGVTCPIG